MLGTLVVLCACTPTKSAIEPTKDVYFPPSALPVATPASSNSAEETARASIAAALLKMAHLRQLPALGSVAGRVISRDEMLRLMQQGLKEETPDSVLRATGELLFALNTVPEAFDYENVMLQLLREQVAGFYDPKAKTMFLSADLDGALVEATLDHELVHALQDQHYDLAAILAPHDDAGDEESAEHALAEGDATSAMMDAVLEPRGITALDIPASAFGMDTALGAAFSGIEKQPLILVRSLTAPYTDGVAFTNALRKRGGWGAVDAAWHRLPRSTEQILHTEKYDADERPEIIELPSAPSGFQTIYHDVLGEQSLRVLFEEWMPVGSAREGAAGWAGDRVAILSSGNTQLTLWHLRFDTERAAERSAASFARGAEQVERVDYASLPVPQSGAKFVHGAVCHLRPTRGPFAIVRRGRDIAVTLGPYSRNSAGARAERDCATAVQWAQSVVQQ